MEINRRLVLKGFALGSVAGWAAHGSIDWLAASPGERSAPSSAPPLLAFVNDDAAGSMFLHGAAIASGARLQAERVDTGFAFLTRFERLLSAGSRPTRIIGLLDNASATLAVDLARAHGARVQWLGLHTSEAGFTRHRVFDTDRSAGSLVDLARRLEVDGTAFELIEERRSRIASSTRWAPPHRGGRSTADWASGVGYALASLVAPLAAPWTRAAPRVEPGPSGSFASFSITT